MNLNSEKIAFKGAWTRLEPMFVYKIYLTWNSTRILTESHPRLEKIEQ